LGHFGVPRDELMAEFSAQAAPAVLTDAGLLGESLGMTVVERQLVARGLSARLATTAPIASLTSLVAVDGVMCAEDDVVLVKDQATAADDGLYAAHAGAWTRVLDAEAASVVDVREGAAN